MSEDQLSSTDPEREPKRDKEVSAGLGMPKGLFILVLVTVPVGAGVVGALSGWNPVIMGATVLTSLVIIAVVVGRSQADLTRFKKENGRWPSQQELDAWNREMYGRRAKAKRVAAAGADVKAAERAYRGRVNKAERALQTARRQHSNAVANARSNLATAQKRHEEAVALAASSLERWRNPGRGSRIATFKRLELYEHALGIRNQVVPISHVQSAIAGNFLTIQIAGSQEVIKLTKQEVPAALEFHTRLAAATTAEMAFERERPQAIPAGEQYLTQVMADTAAIESAGAALVAAEQDAALIAGVREAERSLATVTAERSAVSAAQTSLQAQQDSAADRGGPPPPPTWSPRASNAFIAILGIALVAVVAGSIGVLTTPTRSNSTANIREVSTPAPTETPATAETPMAITSAPPTPAIATPATETQAPSSTLAPTTPTIDSRSLVESNVRKSISDNQTFVVGTNFDALAVTVQGNVVTVQVQPNASWDEKDFFRTGAADGLVSSKAVLGWYPGAQKIHVVLLSKFTDQYGKSSTEPGEWLDVSAATAQKFDYAGLKDRVTVQPSLMYCDADAYYVHPAIWKNLDSGTRGCLSSFSS